MIEHTLTDKNKKNILKCARDNEGQHMIQAIIETFIEEKRLYIYKEIMQHFEALAKDKQGLCVIKKLIEHTKNPKY